MSFGDVSENSLLPQENITKLGIFLQLGKIKINGVEKKRGRDQDSNLGYCGHNAVS